MKKLVLPLLVLGVINLCSAQQAFYDVTAGIGNGIRLWQSDTYKIHMGNTSEYLFGPVNDYSIKTNMGGGTSGRGWTWGEAGSTPVVGINLLGNMQIAGSFTSGGNILQNAENSAFGVDAQVNARLGFIKKFGFSPVLASDNGSPIIFSQTNQNGVSTNISGATLTERMRIDGNGNVGIGLTTPGPQTKLHVFEPGSSASSWRGRIASSGETSAVVMGEVFGKATIGGHNAALTAWSDLVLQAGGGNVGIGTSNPDYKLTVNGSIHAKEVRVDLSVPGPDYVFANDYKLPSLEEIKIYIDENKHLPEVPSAAAMEKNGVQLGEMNMLLLKKIEELTLYVIDQNKKMEELKKQNEKFEKQNEEIQLIKEELKSLNKKSKKK